MLFYVNFYSCLLLRNLKLVRLAAKLLFADASVGGDVFLSGN